MAKLMLVEDDNNLREIYEARLQAEGYQIVTARDGEEALVVAKAEKPDLIISDVMMPKISGFEMLDILRNTEGLQAVKVIMLTALGQSDDQQRADKLGADRYLVKSQVTLEDIVKTAHDLLGESGAAATPAAPAADPAPTPMPSPAPEPSAPAGDPAPAVIPVATEPAAAPAPVSAPEPVAEPAGEAKIEDFVAGASENPSTPNEEKAAEPAVTQVPVTSSDEPTADNAQTADDKLMADAVNNLVAATPGSEATPSMPAASEPETPAPEPAPAAGGTKVIAPLDSAPKKDINQLLAEEEAKEKAAAPAPEAEAKPVEDKVDPNSIAL